MKMIGFKLHCIKKQFLFLSLICLTFLNLNAQTFDSEKIKELKQFEKNRKTAFLNEPYIFTGFGLGPLFGIPAMRTVVPAANGQSFTRDLYGAAYMKIFINARLFVGAHYKRHYFTAQFEDLHIYNNISASYITPDGGGGLQRETFDLLPYVSFMYQYDVLNNNRIFGLQPGFHAGLAIIPNFDGSTKMFSGSGTNGQNADTQLLEGETTTLQRLGFGFGPSLNLEVNFARWFSLNFYQQFTYVAGPVIKNEFVTQYNGESPQYAVTNSNLLNYSMNISLRFKMYLPKTRFKVAEKMNGN